MNLEKAKRTVKISTLLGDLYGSKMADHIRVNDEFWYYLTNDEELKNGWYKIVITYIRSKVYFYKYVDYPHREEEYFPIESVFPMLLKPVTLSLSKEGLTHLKPEDFEEDITNIIV